MARRLPSTRQTAAKRRALSAVADLRRGDARSLSEAARNRGTTVRSIQKFVPSAVRRPEGSRRWQARPGDTYATPMLVLTPQGRRTIVVAGSRKRSLVGRHWNAVRRFVETGDESALAEFAGMSVGGYDLMTDPDDIQATASRGELEDIEVYAPSVG